LKYLISFLFNILLELGIGIRNMMDFSRQLLSSIMSKANKAFMSMISRVVFAWKATLELGKLISSPPSSMMKLFEMEEFMRFDNGRFAESKGSKDGKFEI